MIKATTLSTTDLFRVDQFDVKSKGCVGRNNRRIATRSIRQFRRNDQPTLAADLHPDDSLVPALDNLSCAEPEAKWLLALVCTIAHATIWYLTRVVRAD